MEEHENKNPLNGKKIVLFVVYGLIAVFLMITVLSLNDLPSIFEQLKTVDFSYILLAALMIMLYLAVYPISLNILTKAKKTNVSSGITYVIGMTEHFFNGITPWATGGQPFQAYSFSKAKVKLSESTGLLLANLVIYLISANTISIMALFFFSTIASSIDSWWLPVIFTGYALNFTVLTVMVLLGTSKTLRGWLVRMIRSFCKFKSFNKFSGKADNVEKYFVQMQEAFRYLTHKKWHFALAVITKIISLIFLDSSTYFMLLSLNIPVQPSHIILIIAGTSFAATAVGFVPTPGAAGGIEGSTGQVFKSLIIYILSGTSVTTVVACANGVVLIWRLLSYYLVMLISLLFYLGLELYFRRKKNKQTEKIQ